MDELAIKIKEGNEAAFNSFFHQTHYKVVRYLRNLLDHDGYAHDIAQEVYLKVWRNRQQIDPHRPLTAWLFAIVRNCALTHVRKMLVEKRQMTVLSRNFPSPTNTYNAGEDKLRAQDAMDVFVHATKLVPPQFVRCLILHRKEGLTYRQIAEREGVSVKTVEKRISITLRHLRSADGLVITLFISGIPHLITLY